MSCRLDYIDNIPLITDSEKQNLTDLHLDISKRLYSHRADIFGTNSKIFKYHGGKLFVPGDGIYYNQATRLVDLINRENGSDDIVKLIKDPATSLRYVSVDVRALVSGQPVVDELADIFPFLKNYFGDTELATGSEEFEDPVTQHEEVFQNLSNSIKQKAAIYLNSLEKSGDTFKAGKTERDLRRLLGALNDPSTYGIMEGLSKYITISSYNLNNVRKRLSIIDNKIKNLDSDPEVRKQQLKEVSDFVRHTSYYYHLFDKLDDIRLELEKLDVNPRAVDNYERDLLETSLKDWMTNIGLFSEQEILDYLNQVPTLLNDSGKMFLAFKDLYKSKIGENPISIQEMDQLQLEMDNILQENLKPSAGIYQQLDNLIKSLGPLKDRLKSLHYDTLTEIYYPAFANSFDAGKMSIDGTESLDDKWKISKKDFKTLLQIGEKDISYISKWGSAMINVSETIPATIANYFKDVVIDINLNNKEDVGGLQSFLTQHNREQGDSALREFDSNAVYETLTIEDLEEVDETFIPDSGDGIVEMTVLGIPGKFRARQTRNLLNQFDTVAYHNLKKVFTHRLDDVVDDLSTKLMNDRYSLTDLENSSDEILREFYGFLYTKAGNDTLIKNYMGKFFQENPTHYEVKDLVRRLLWGSFYRTNLSVKQEKEVDQMFEDHGVTENGRLVDLNDDKNSRALKHVLRNSYFVDFKENARGTNLAGTFYSNPDSLFGQYNNAGATKIAVVKYSDLTYGYVEVMSINDRVVINNPSNKDIQEYAIFSGDYNTLRDKYHIEKGGFNQQVRDKWNWVQNDSFNKDYFDRLIDLYKKGKDNHSSEALLNREVPQVAKTEDQGRFAEIQQGVKNIKKDPLQFIYDQAQELLVKENESPRMRNGEYIDENGNVITDPQYITRERQYINGQKIRDVKMRFVQPIPLQELETDLYKSILLYKTSSNSYRGMKNNESQALLLQTVLEGDSKLGIDPRKVKIKNRNQDVQVVGAGPKLKEVEIRSTEMMISFINSYVYGIENEDFGILGTKLSAKKITSMISGYTAYNALAWNIMTMPSNKLIALHNMKTVAQGNEFFNEEDFIKARRVYNLNIPKFMSDFKNAGFTNKKSFITQLIIQFDAIQGEFLSANGIIQTKTIGDKLSDSALYWTQELVEHGNQTQSMIMMMMGYKLPSGRSLWTALEEENHNRLDGEAIRMPSEFTRDEQIKFQKKLQGMNRIIHGNYSKLDKTMLQKNVITNMMMTFKKYIYDGFRSRFMEERFDQELRDEAEGYFRTYLKALNREFSEVAKTQGITAALKDGGWKSIGTSMLKTTLGGWDAATFRLLSKNNAKAKEYLYGENVTERQYYAAMKATYDIGNIIRAMLVIIAVEAIMAGLDDDDVWTRKTLSYIDLYARKLEGDIGFFTSFTNFATGSPGGATLDQMYRMIKQPFAAVRSIDNTSGLFKQLTDFDVINENGEFELSWSGNDRYEKSGAGYEKGDLKINRKLQKSALAPVWQMYKLLSPEEQLNYMSMTQKYSN